MIWKIFTSKDKGHKSHLFLKSIGFKSYLAWNQIQNFYLHGICFESTLIYNKSE